MRTVTVTWFDDVGRVIARRSFPVHAVPSMTRLFAEYPAAARIETM